MARRRDSARTDDWSTKLREILGDGTAPLHLVGVGNKLRSDDAAGLEIVSSLRSKLKASHSNGLKAHPVSSMPERLLSRLASDGERIVVFDAVEAGREPGEIVCCSLAETKFGFFATHNVPFRLIPGLAARENDVFIVGIQPESLEVGEGITDRVEASCQKIVNLVSEIVEVRP